jgi:hypothetical protein
MHNAARATRTLLSMPLELYLTLSPLIPKATQYLGYPLYNISTHCYKDCVFYNVKHPEQNPAAYMYNVDS